MDDYYSITTEVFATMRLTIEGAVALYEGVCAPIYGMLRKEDTEAARAYSIIGKALYELRQNVASLEKAAEDELVRLA